MYSRNIDCSWRCFLHWLIWSQGQYTEETISTVIFSGIRGTFIKINWDQVLWLIVLLCRLHWMVSGEKPAYTEVYSWISKLSRSGIVCCSTASWLNNLELNLNKWINIICHLVKSWLFFLSCFWVFKNCSCWERTEICIVLPGLSSCSSHWNFLVCLQTARGDRGLLRVYVTDAGWEANEEKLGGPYWRCNQG